MTDLTNKVDKLIKDDLDSFQNLVNKYGAVLQEVLPEKIVPYVAYIIDISVTYLQGSHNTVNADWKAWSVLLIKKLFEDGNIKNEQEIVPIIDEFLEYKEKEYNVWCKDVISATNYDRDRGFFYRFYWKKNGSH